MDLSSSVLVKREQRECKTLSEPKTDKLKNDSQQINLIKDTYCLPSRGKKKSTQITQRMDLQECQGFTLYNDD